MITVTLPIKDSTNSTLNFSTKTESPSNQQLTSNNTPVKNWKTGKRLFSQFV